jgi:DNA-binding NarL/FixJ family response regulator
MTPDEPAAADEPGRGLRVVLVDDDAAARQGLRMLLLVEPDIEVVGEAADGRQAIEAVHRLHPDVLVMDLAMPEMGGLEASRLLADEGVTTRVLVMTILESADTVYEALRSGASGFLLKDSAHALLALAVRVVAAGDALVDPRLTQQVITEVSRARAGSVEARQRVGALSARETEVLHLVTKGLSNQEIAIALTVSESTVKSHVSNMLSKLEVRDRVQAVILAFEAGVVDSAP